MWFSSFLFYLLIAILWVVSLLFWSFFTLIVSHVLVVNVSMYRTNKHVDHTRSCEIVLWADTAIWGFYFTFFLKVICVSLSFLTYCCSPNRTFMDNLLNVDLLCRPLLLILSLIIVTIMLTAMFWCRSLHLQFEDLYWAGAVGRVMSSTRCICFQTKLVCWKHHGHRLTCYLSWYCLQCMRASESLYWGVL